MASEAHMSTDALPPLPSASPTTIYHSLRDYPFDQDSEYLSGLSAILGHPETPPTQEELSSNPDLILQARCFYFARRNSLSPIDPAAYKDWLAQNPASTDSSVDAISSSTTSQLASDIASNIAPSQPAPFTSTTTQQPPPPYPTSFAAIVDLITRNVPVPGIEDIPTTVLEHGSSKVDHTPRRRKPWETDASAEEPSLPILPVVTDQVSLAGGSTSEPATTSSVSAGDDAEGVLDATAPATSQDISPQSEGGRDAGTSVNGHLTTGEGVVKILQEGAIPDSGLLARD